MTGSLRLLIDPPLTGAANMARDEALLDAAAGSECSATLRFYRWAEPTISLGYFQRYAEYESACATRWFPVVRRTTGGGAILHDRELTYALAVPRAHPLLEPGPANLYCLVHDAIVEVMRGSGIPAERRGHTSAAEAKAFFCFGRTHALDIVVGGSKLAGSAQRRTRGGVLQHGSIVLEATHARQPSAAVADHCRIDPDELARRIAGRFADDNGLARRPGEWEAAELDRANHHAARYNAPTWTRRR